MQDRRAAYQEAMRHAGLAVRPEWIIDVGWEGSPENAFEPLRALLTAPERPTALFAWYDGVAIKVLHKAQEWGLRVPEDLSIIGFNSPPSACSLLRP